MSYLRKKVPILLSIAATSAFACLLLYSRYLLELIPWSLKGSEYRYQMCGELIIFIFALILIFSLGERNVLKDRGIGFRKGLIPCLYIIFTVFYAAVENLKLALQAEYSFAPIGQIVEFILAMVLVGLTEEFVFRGFVSKIIYDKYGDTPAQVWISVLISGSIFGFMHIANAITVGNVASALVQSLNAVAIGMAYTAIFYRTKNLWIVVFLHIFNNLSALLQSGLFIEKTFSDTLGAYTTFHLIGIIPYVILTVVLLRPDKMKEIVKTKKSSSFEHLITAVIIAVALFVITVITAFALLPETLKLMLQSVNY